MKLVACTFGVLLFSRAWWRVVESAHNLASMLERVGEWWSVMAKTICVPLSFRAAVESQVFLLAKCA
jgi:hypothetical protein